MFINVFFEPGVSSFLGNKIEAEDAEKKKANETTGMHKCSVKIIYSL